MTSTEQRIPAASRPLTDGVLIETDVLCDFLVARNSCLRKVLGLYPCYTTVINASELFAIGKDDAERNAMMALLSGIRVLGLHPKYALKIGEIARNNRARGMKERDAIVIGTAIASRLPIVTEAWAEKYKGYGGVRVVSQSEMTNTRVNVQI